jgi:hypothetical protein
MINSLEFGHIYEAARTSITTNFFYRHTSGQMDYITFIEDGISYSQPANLNNSQSYGIEIIAAAEFTPWWTVSGSVTGFGITVDGSNIGEEFVNNGYAMNTKVTTDLKLPLNFTVQLVYNYESPEIEAQGKDLAQYYLDASIQKSFFNKKAVLSVSARDVFNTRQFSGINESSTFSQSFTRKRETQIILVSARFNF